MRKYILKTLVFSALPTALIVLPVHAEGDSGNGMRLDHVPVQEDTAIVIKKNPKTSIDKPDYEIISGDAEVLGDPESGTKAGYSSWKSACEGWKKETKELNKDNQVLIINCGAPSFTQEGGVYTYKSKGTYKIRVRMKINPDSK